MGRAEALRWEEAAAILGVTKHRASLAWLPGESGSGRGVAAPKSHGCSWCWGCLFLVRAALTQQDLGACLRLLRMHQRGRVTGLSEAGCKSFVFLLYLGFLAKVCCSSSCRRTS